MQDPDAAVAFLEDFAAVSVRPDDFWRDRTSGAASGPDAAQFIAEEQGEWIGTLTILRRAAR